MYQAYDVTNLLAEGNHALGVTLADSWYAGHLTFVASSANWGNRLGLLLQLEVTYVDGSTDVVVSDRTFTSSPGPIRYVDLMIGDSTTRPGRRSTRSSTR